MLERIAWIMCVLSGWMHRAYKAILVIQYTIRSHICLRFVPCYARAGHILVSGHLRHDEETLQGCSQAHCILLRLFQHSIQVDFEIRNALEGWFTFDWDIVHVSHVNTILWTGCLEPQISLCLFRMFCCPLHLKMEYQGSHVYDQKLFSNDVVFWWLPIKIKFRFWAYLSLACHWFLKVLVPIFWKMKFL